MPTTANKLHTLSQIKYAASTGASPHWFSSDSMRFFNSRVSERVYPVPGGAYFVTSERYDRYDNRYPRAYTVRHCDLEGSIHTVGEFQQYETSAQAHCAAQRLQREAMAAAAAAAGDAALQLQQREAMAAAVAADAAAA